MIVFTNTSVPTPLFVSTSAIWWYVSTQLTRWICFISSISLIFATSIDAKRLPFGNFLFDIMASYVSLQSTNASISINSIRISFSHFQEVICPKLQELLFFMHSFLTAKVASVDPSFMSVKSGYTNSKHIGRNSSITSNSPSDTINHSSWHVKGR